ncbi:glycine zipper family protein [Pseudomonas sp. COW5]|uniref:glycine zipper family protein n=1 Tax=Pseudomonas sp. COW5 TaxID=2981253 RepID=UPI0022474CA9|nr:glycine zipper family protein [Pseudomonas sp. COW5]MCX2546943.1 glycine zipper family protein [Pseudomonas sp. COW5]
MTEFSCKIPTNKQANSVSNVPGYLMPANIHLFVVVDEIGKDGFLVRKIYSSPDNPHLIAKNLSELQIKNEIWPEKYGMRSVAPDSGATVAQHVYSSRKYPSGYISTSSEFPNGSPRFEGKTVYIDIEKAKAAGAKLVSTEEILKALEDYKKHAPKNVAKIDEIAGWVKNIDKEVLIQADKVPAKAIFTPTSHKVTNAFIKGARVVRVFGIAFTAYDLKVATEESIKQNSIKPISVEVVKQAGGWGAAIAGARIGVVVGAAVGIETGPGAVVSGAIGGIIFGTAGYLGATWLTEYMQE